MVDNHGAIMKYNPGILKLRTHSKPVVRRVRLVIDMSLVFTSF